MPAEPMMKLTDATSPYLKRRVCPKIARSMAPSPHSRMPEDSSDGVRGYKRATDRKANVGSSRPGRRRTPPPTRNRVSDAPFPSAPPGRAAPAPGGDEQKKAQRNEAIAALTTNGVNDRAQMETTRWVSLR